MLQIFMDESGTHEGSPVIAVGAYLGTPQAWSAWTRKWSAQKRPIEVFHASECNDLRGEFKGWTREEKNEYVKNLLPVLGKAPLFASVAGVRLNDYREIADEFPELKEVLGKTPHTPCFQWALQNIFALMDRNDDPQPVAIVHEINDFMGEAQATFKFLQERYPHREMTLEFGSKSSYPPLQAADILAYEGNRQLRKPDGVPRKAWLALNPSGGRRELKYFDRAALANWAKGARELRLKAFLSAVKV